MEPIILELEREQNDLLIIAHESVLRVLYSYLMHCSAMDIPKLKFPRNKIIEIIPAAYQNEAKIIRIPGLDIPQTQGSNSPDNVFFRHASPLLTFGSGAATSAGGSGAMSPIQGLSGGNFTSPPEPLEPLTLPPASSGTPLQNTIVQSPQSTSQPQSQGNSQVTSQPQSRTHSRIQSETVSPTGSPSAQQQQWAPERVVNKSKEAVADKVADED